MTWINEGSRKYNPHGGWKWRDGLDEAVLRSALRKGTSVEQGMQRLRRVCACCHRPYLEARIQSNVCDGCRVHLRCSGCHQDFVPGEGTLGTLCSQCWFFEQELVRSELEAMTDAQMRRRLYAVYRKCFETDASCARASSRH